MRINDLWTWLRGHQVPVQDLVGAEPYLEELPLDQVGNALEVLVEVATAAEPPANGRVAGAIFELGYSEASTGLRFTTGF